MPFIKLDCGVLDSTLWPDREAREVFITALLMALPHEVREPMQQLHVRSLEPTGFAVPCGDYGFVRAAGVGIVRRAGIEEESGLDALERLGSGDPESRSPEWEGRRLVRVAGGFIALNFDKYRQKDQTSADRSRRYRERVSGVSSRVTSCSITQAEVRSQKLEVRSQKPEERERDADAEHDGVCSPSILPLTTGPTTDRDRWRMHEASQPWAKALKAALCKIGPENWTAWKGLADEFPIAVVLSAAKGVPATERWPDRVEQTLRASRGQENPGDVVAHKIRKITL